MTFLQFSDYYRPLIDRYLISLFDSFVFDDSRFCLRDAMVYSLSAKAKRLRPILVLAVFSMYRGRDDLDQVMPLAAAIEMVHTYSLIHDDLPAMDNDDFRRGVPTCHKQFDEATAILAGDTLNTFAWELVARELPRYFDPLDVLRVVSRFADALGLMGMAGGQMMDLRSSQTSLDADYLARMHSLKTGRLLSACLELPAILLTLPQRDIKCLIDYGDQIGLLFQIVDDILDVEGNQAVLGKSLGKDQAMQKLTYPALWGMDRTKAIAKETADGAKQCLSGLGVDTAMLAQLVDYIYGRDH